MQQMEKMLATDGEDAANVWDSNFVGVWHLHDDFNDSTGNGNDGTNSGTTDTTGIVGNGQLVDSASEYIDFGDNIDPGYVTLSIWLKPQHTWSSEAIREFLGQAGSRSGFMFYEAYDKFSFYVGDGSIWMANSLGTTIPQQGTWYHVVGTWDGTTGYIYVNGTQEDSDSQGTGTARFTTYTFRVGQASYSNWQGSDPLDSIVDEIRVSDIARSADWIKFEYHNIAEADNELTFGSEEISGAPSHRIIIVN